MLPGRNFLSAQGSPNQRDVYPIRFVRFLRRSRLLIGNALHSAKRKTLTVEDNRDITMDLVKN
jgi:hypothetical protein